MIINETFEKLKLDNNWKSRDDIQYYHIYAIQFQDMIEIGFSGYASELSSIRQHKDLYVTGDLVNLFSSKDYELLTKLYIDTLKLDIVSNYMCSEKDFKKIKKIYEQLKG